MIERRQLFGALGSRSRRVIAGTGLGVAVALSGALVAIALTANERSVLAGSVPESVGSYTSPTPTPSPRPTAAASPAPSAPAAPSPAPAPSPVIPVVDGSPQLSSEYVQFSESIPFGSVTQEDPTQPVGTSYVSVAGSPGTLLTTVEVLYTDGEETSRSVVSQEVVQAPVDQVTIVGTAAPAAPAPTDPTGPSEPTNPTEPIDPVPELPEPTSPPVPDPGTALPAEPTGLARLE